MKTWLKGGIIWGIILALISFLAGFLWGINTFAGSWRFSILGIASGFIIGVISYTPINLKFSYELKGGIIALILYAVSIHIGGFFAWIPSLLFLSIFEYIFHIGKNAYLPYYFIGDTEFGVPPTILGWITLLISIFLIGVLVGWIIKKVKSKKEITSSD